MLKRIRGTEQNKGGLDGTEPADGESAVPFSQTDVTDGRRTPRRCQVCWGLTDHLSPLLWLEGLRRAQAVDWGQMEERPVVKGEPST